MTAAVILAALSLVACVTPGSIDRAQQAAAISEAMGSASPEIDAVVARSANHGFAPANVYDVYIPELDDENVVSIVDRMLGAVAPVVAGDDAVEFILYSTTYSEDPIVEFGPFNAEAGILDELGLDTDGDGDSRDGEGHFTVHPDDLQRVYGS